MTTENIDVPFRLLARWRTAQQ